MKTVIAGTNWGDEGKGRMVDLLASQYDIVVRYQGGNNAGHTVVNEKGKFILNLLPSGVLRDKTVNVMGNGMVIDLEHLCGEISRLNAAGIVLTPDHLKISDKAVICMPYHKQLDGMEEDRLKGEKFGSTRRGIAPSYADKYYKKALRLGDLFDMEATYKKLCKIVEWKNLTYLGYGETPIDADAMFDWLKKYGEQLLPYVTDTGLYLSEAEKAHKNIVFEAQLGALRDIDFGIYPYTTSSSTIASYAPIGAGVPWFKLDSVVGIMKAYSSCVGEGPFTCELFGDEGSRLREAGAEYGAATGRPRRVGGFDVVASKYGVRMQGCTCVALTKLDVLSYLDKIPVCVAYEVDGKATTEFVTGEKLNRAKPIYEYLDGWKCDISGARKLSDLPQAAINYVQFIEKAVGCPVQYVSVGAERDSYVEL